MLLCAIEISGLLVKKGTTKRGVLVPYQRCLEPFVAVATFAIVALTAVVYRKSYDGTNERKQ